MDGARTQAQLHLSVEGVIALKPLFAEQFSEPKILLCFIATLIGKGADKKIDIDYFVEQVTAVRLATGVHH